MSAPLPPSLQYNWAVFAVRGRRRALVRHLTDDEVESIGERFDLDTEALARLVAWARTEWGGYLALSNPAPQGSCP